MAVRFGAGAALIPLPVYRVLSQEEGDGVGPGRVADKGRRRLRLLADVERRLRYPTVKRRLLSGLVTGFVTDNASRQLVNLSRMKRCQKFMPHNGCVSCCQSRTER